MSFAARRIGRAASFSILLGLGICIFVGGLLATYVPYHERVQAPRSGDFRVVEGPLEHFVQDRAERPAEDQTFTISGRRFDIDFWDLNGFKGFNVDPSAMIGDPSGKRFRITYIDANPPFILRIQLLDE